MKYMNDNIATPPFHVVGQRMTGHRLLSETAEKIKNILANEPIPWRSGRSLTNYSLVGRDPCDPAYGNRFTHPIPPHIYK